MAWLADPAREGRGVGTEGLEAAGAYLEERFKALGLEPAGDDGGFREPFEVTTRVTSGPGTDAEASRARRSRPSDFVAAGLELGQGAVKGNAVLAGYGIQDAELGLDDFKGLDVKGKIVVVRRFVPEHEKLATPEAQRRAGDLRKKACVARARGAKALVVVDWPVVAALEGSAGAEWTLPPEAALPDAPPRGHG